MSEDAKKTESAPPVESAPAGGGSKLVPIIMVLNLLLTAGIGTVVFLQFQKDKHKESVADIQADAPAAEKGGEGEHGKKEEAKGEEHGGGEHGEHGKEAAAAKTGDQIINLEQFTANLSTSPGTPVRFARLAIAVEVPSSDTAGELNQKMAQVRNAIIDLINSKRLADLESGEGKNFLKEEIRNALNSFLVTGKVKGVFFSNFQIGP
jgi:flagellar protein FliL